MAGQLDALRELLAKVKVGSPTQDNFTAAFPSAWPRDAMRAYHDKSLDAAKALHEAMLPGWGWHIRQDEDGSYASCLIAPHYRVTPGCQTDPDPARAWLAAILKALIAEAERPAPNPAPEE